MMTVQTTDPGDLKMLLITEMPTLLFIESFLSTSTPKYGNLPISGKFCAIEFACNFENLPIFGLNPPYFLDVNVGISVLSSQR